MTCSVGTPVQRFVKVSLPDAEMARIGASGVRVIERRQ